MPYFLKMFVIQSLSHVQFLCNPMNFSMPGFPLLYSHPRVCSSSYPLSWWCHPTISSLVIHFSSCLKSFPAIRVFSSESALHIRWPKYWSFSFSISPSNKYSGLISFRTDWFNLLAVQGTLKNPFQQHSLKASVLQHSAFFMVQLSHLYMTSGKIIALIIWNLSAKWCLCFLICCLGWS